MGYGPEVDTDFRETLDSVLDRYYEVGVQDHYDASVELLARQFGWRLPGASVHGTGCALSAAIAAGLARGDALRDAVVGARSFVRSAIENAHQLENGARILAFT